MKDIKTQCQSNHQRLCDGNVEPYCHFECPMYTPPYTKEQVEALEKIERDMIIKLANERKK